MAITDAQKVDYLFKKLGYSVTKTDTSTVKSASNENIASPIIIRGSSIWAQSDSVPATIPTSNSSIVNVYSDALSSTVQATNDGTASTNRTWKTNLTEWIDSSFGATYQVKVYLATTGNATPQTSGTQLFADGSGNNDEWFFDYTSGVLNFIGTNLPSGTFTGKSIFISGARYVGNKGLEHLGNVDFSGDISAVTITENTYRVLTTDSNIQVTGDAIGSGTYSNIALTLADSGVVAGIYGSADDEIADKVPKITVDSKGRITSIANVSLTQVGNLSFNDTTISTTSSITLNSANNGNITLNANGTGIVKISGNDAIAIPSGNTSTRPSTVSSGYLRYNTDIGTIEFYNGEDWTNNQSAASMTSQNIVPDGITNVFTLYDTATTNGVLVSINGTMQQPTTAYTVNGKIITFTEIPLPTDAIEVRAMALIISSVTAISDGTTRAETDSVTGEIRFINAGTENVSISQTGAIVTSAPTISVPTSATPTIIDSYDSTIYRTARYTIQSTRLTNFESYEVMITHNGTSAFYKLISSVNTGTSLGTMSATISGSTVQLKYTSSYANTSIRMSKSYIII